MNSIKGTIWSRPARSLAVLALFILTIVAIVGLGPDTVASAFLDHVGSAGPRAGGTGQAPAPGLVSVSYTGAIRVVTVFARRALSR